jgi:hypothetical protein
VPHGGVDLPKFQVQLEVLSSRERAVYDCVLKNDAADGPGTNRVPGDVAPGHQGPPGRGLHAHGLEDALGPRKVTSVHKLESRRFVYRVPPQNDRARAPFCEALSSSGGQ